MMILMVPAFVALCAALPLPNAHCLHKLTLLTRKTRNLLLTMAAIIVTDYTTFNGRLTQV